MTKIWIDLDNTPHVPFFIPIIDELKRQGHEVVLTARDAFQVCELADEMGLTYLKVGRHYGKNRAMKILGLVWRAAQLMPFALRQRPTLACSHGSRAQLLLCNLLRIPAVVMDDYEHSKTLPFARPRWAILPQALAASPALGKEPAQIQLDPSRYRYYRGIKEDVYVPRFRPDRSILEVLGIADGRILITVRPPADEAHYYRPESDELLVALMDRVCGDAGARAVLLPRNRHQEDRLRRAHPDWFREAKTIVPPSVVNGLNLLWFSDLIVSGGGTMNREAAALGIPVYSIFRGRIGAVDRQLEQEGRLVLITGPEDVRTKIRFAARDKTGDPEARPRAALADIVGYIEEILRIEKGQTKP